MSFENLPDLHVTPITDHIAADVVDLFASERDRAAGGLCLLLLDDRDVLVQPVVVQDIPPTAMPELPRAFADGLRDLLSDTGGSLMFIRMRTGSSLRTVTDLGWAQSIRASLTDANRCRLHSAWLATPGYIRRLDRRDVAERAAAS